MYIYIPILEPNKLEIEAVGGNKYMSVHLLPYFVDMEGGRSPGACKLSLPSFAIRKLRQIESGGIWIRAWKSHHYANYQNFE